MIHCFLWPLELWLLSVWGYRPPLSSWGYEQEYEQEYNDVHGFYCARVEHLFGRLWHWKIARDVWMGSARDLHQNEICTSMSVSCCT